MEVQTRQGPAYGVARLTLAPNEPVRVESGAMMAMSAGVVLQSKAEGGVMKSLKRAALGGESFFVSTYTAPRIGWLRRHRRPPARATSRRTRSAPGQALFIQKGSWLANEVNVKIDTQWGGFKNLFGGEGGFIIRAEGQGTIVFACYGALEVWNLGSRSDDHRSTPATWSPTRTPIQMAMRKASGGGLGAELQERRGLRVRLQRARSSVDADPQPERS